MFKMFNFNSHGHFTSRDNRVLGAKNFIELRQYANKNSERQVSVIWCSMWVLERVGAEGIAATTGRRLLGGADLAGRLDDPLFGCPKLARWCRRWKYQFDEARCRSNRTTSTRTVEREGKKIELRGSAQSRR
ncbi:hypothetical protein ACFX15_034093 [Malus domestica]